MSIHCLLGSVTSGLMPVVRCVCCVWLLQKEFWHVFSGHLEIGLCFGFGSRLTLRCPSVSYRLFWLCRLSEWVNWFLLCILENYKQLILQISYLLPSALSPLLPPSPLLLFFCLLLFSWRWDCLCFSDWSLSSGLKRDPPFNLKLPKQMGWQVCSSTPHFISCLRCSCYYMFVIRRCFILFAPLSSSLSFFTPWRYFLGGEKRVNWT